ncbi:MAG: hypothetical protein Q8J68_12365 [Methanolobus sp.]|uniref:hypothetical protein n=1 Tax=Methanolobus sp. TaxID=1874737 RepID=UPI00273077FC|nr:hypothetical protein [Methanolobus sp.]MDP2218067.1 hypothetical protein [Methanolobus sp.]
MRDVGEHLGFVKERGALKRGGFQAPHPAFTTELWMWGLKRYWGISRIRKERGASKRGGFPSTSSYLPTTQEIVFLV